MANQPLFELQTLLEKQEIAHMNLLGVVIHAIGNLNLSDPPAALRTLMRGLELCVEARSNIDRFQSKLDLERKQTQSDKENQSDGNRTAA